ncbi:Hypothetical predicted protein [Podarcis lilfordi]|uniref:Uncharacterized protein n=1 Tax=Podarcis lilfordi TaxID=74358 RepID=A0AA35JVS9_9SAUR|nr:Hypothetical predicted protein [Podarcis lilfordi]
MAFCPEICRNPLVSLEEGLKVQGCTDQKTVDKCTLSYPPLQHILVGYPRYHSVTGKCLKPCCAFLNSKSHGASDYHAAFKQEESWFRHIKLGPVPNDRASNLRCCSVAPVSGPT